MEVVNWLDGYQANSIRARTHGMERTCAGCCAHENNCDSCGCVVPFMGDQLFSGAFCEFNLEILEWLEAAYGRDWMRLKIVHSTGHSHWTAEQVETSVKYCDKIGVEWYYDFDSFEGQWYEFKQADFLEDGSREYESESDGEYEFDSEYESSEEDSDM
eukprot:Phypoly_transcript_23516.p1 GENE.Phypoly_transcript_23516~~Phypoly_transcript_23516.p1  ORF type:complete len:158 (+),score=18.08 Phypoly_transcript_23516:75-548(+)